MLFQIFGPLKVNANMGGGYYS